MLQPVTPGGYSHSAIPPVAMMPHRRVYGGRAAMAAGLADDNLDSIAERRTPDLAGGPLEGVADRVEGGVEER